MTNNYIKDITADMERLDWNKFRFFNEPGTWWDALLIEIDAWLETDTDMFLKNFITDKPWINQNIARTQYPEVVNGKPVFFQWTITNGGKNLEFACKRLTTEQAKNFGL